MVMGDLTIETDVAVIGSGPGGYAAAFRAADLGLDVTMVDTEIRPGGECLYASGLTRRYPCSMSQWWNSYVE